MIHFKPNKLGYIAIAIMVIAIVVLIRRRSIKKLAEQTISFIKEKTWDIVSDRRIDTLKPSIRQKVRNFINAAERELGIKLRVTSALRTNEEQEKLYAQGRTEPGNIVTNARAGKSKHNLGLAFDVVEIKDGKAIWNNQRWDEIGRLGKSFGFRWGGDFRTIKDYPHFEI